MLWLILNSWDVLHVWPQEHVTHKPFILLNQCHLSPLDSFPHLYPSSSIHPTHLFFPPFSFVPFQELASYRLLSWLGRSWLRWCCFHSAVGWKINEANNPENSISSLECTTWTLKHIPFSSTHSVPKNIFFEDRKCTCVLSVLSLVCDTYIIQHYLQLL